MDEIKIEETNANPEVEETPVEENPQMETETPNEKTDSPEQYSEREKRYYARMKQAESIAKQARDELGRIKKTSTVVSDIDAILEVQEATRGLSAPEIAELKLRADALKVPLTEARKNENFALWQKAWKEKVEKENVPLPSTAQGNVNREKTLSEMTLDERTELFEKAGLIAKQTLPRPPRR